MDVYLKFEFELDCIFHVKRQFGTTSRRLGKRKFEVKMLLRCSVWHFTAVSAKFSVLQLLKTWQLLKTVHCVLLLVSHAISTA